ncbi:MAG: N-acetylmuramic acid 6-phosphate etherase [Erysipelotrichaceae bacterium]|nr:N-acetylmuramic acid 6-phosphate etherase [Erysipelotrichaceae bacterium]
METDKLQTEQRNDKTMNLDLMSVEEIVALMNEEDLNVYETIKEARPAITELIDATITAYNNGGRIIYLGAGTSGRLGLMDAVEVVPTYNSDRFVGLIAGGDMAFVKAVEGAEDSKDLAVSDLKNIGLCDKDLVIGIAASGRTPYVIGGLEYARSIGCVTGCICCNKDTAIGKVSDHKVEVDAGPEILTGSTRLKSGTCQKIILNMVSTVTMIKVGKVYGNLMVDVRATNEKLVERCHRVVMEATGCTYETAADALKQTGNSCKTAIVMILLGLDKEEAIKRLEEASGNIRKAIGQ